MSPPELESIRVARWRKGGAFLSGASLCFLFAFSGCHSTRVQVARELPARQQQWAEHCLESAIFSAIAYKHDDRSKDDQRLTELEEKLHERGWIKRGTCNRNVKGDGYGLYFEVWENRRRTPREIMFAFRGTTSGPDWGANLRWLRFQKPRDHYVAAREECLPLIEKFWNENGPKDRPLIRTTGHSLGGGVAQQILYAASDKVDQCIVFDPSPITAMHELNPFVRKVYRQQLNRSKFSQYRIIRAYARGEILMYARNLIYLFYKPDTQTQSIEFNTPGRLTAVGRHSIWRLTEEIERLAIQDVPPVGPITYNPEDLRPPLRPPVAYQEDPNYAREITRTRR